MEQDVHCGMTCWILNEFKIFYGTHVYNDHACAKIVAQTDVIFMCFTGCQLFYVGIILYIMVRT